MKKNILIILCVILCITTIGCKSKFKNDFADLTVYEDRIKNGNANVKETYIQRKKILEENNFSKEEIEFYEKYIKLLSRVAYKMLSVTSEDGVIYDESTWWQFRMDEPETLNLSKVYTSVNHIVDTIEDEGNEKRDLSLSIILYLKDDRTISDELYYVLEEVTDEFSKEEWQELIDKEEAVKMDIGDFSLVIDEAIRISTYLH